MNRRYLAGLLLVPMLALAAESAKEPAKDPANEPAKEAAKEATNETAKESAKPAEVEAAKSATREAVRARIADAAMTAMLASGDADAMVLVAKWARKDKAPDGITDPGKDDEANERQAAVLSKALSLSPTPSELVEYQVVAFCETLPKMKLCEDQNRTLNFANHHIENVTGWITAAAHQFTTGFNEIAQIMLESGAKATRSDWFYSRGLAVARRYVKAVEDKDAQPGDAEVAIERIGREVSMPPYPRFAQMCNPNAEGKLPDGRYALCRKVANLLLEQGKSVREQDLALGVLMRLANGEKDNDKAKLYQDRMKARRDSVSYVWDKLAKFPPQSEADAKFFARFIDDTIEQGEVKAYELALQRAGKKMDDFLPKA